MTIMRIINVLMKDNLLYFFASISSRGLFWASSGDKMHMMTPDIIEKSKQILINDTFTIEK